MTDWPVQSLRGLAEVALGRQRAPQHDQGPHMVQYLRAANVSDGRLNLDDIKEMSFTPSEQLLFALRPGDVLVTEGSGSLRTVGASAVWQGEIPGIVCFQNTLLRLRPRDRRTDPRFLLWWSRAAFADGAYASIASGANIFHLSAERVRALPVHCPPIDTQRRIADFLDTETARIDRLVALQSAVRDVTLARIRAQLDFKIDELISQYGDLPFRRTIWSIEQGFSPQCDNFPADPEDWGVLKVSAVKNGAFIESENKQLPAEVEPERRYEIRGGDLLITRANTPQLVGAAAVAHNPRGKLMLCDKIFRVKTTRDLVPEFLVLVSLGTRIRDMCAESSHGTSQSMANLKIEDIKRWPIPAAPAQVQRTAVAGLSEARDHALSLAEAIDWQLALLAERKQALITAAVTGEITV